MSSASMTPERVYLYHRELEKLVQAQETRLQVLEHFIKQQFPEYFAGEVGTVVDDDINPIAITYGEPQERFNEVKQKWERRNAAGEWE